MNNFDFCSPTQYVFGRGVESRTGELTVSVMKAGHVLIVYGGGSAERSGLLGRVRRSLAEAGVTYEELGGVRPNPTDDKVREGIALCRKRGVDGVLAVGGGSAIDTAKAIAGGVLYDGDFWDFFSGRAVPERALPVGVVLTIAAAGSEGSGNSVITKLDGMVKISIRTNVLRPKFSILNPELTMTLPPFQTACGIADMMAHIMERYFSNTSDCELTDRLCEATLRAIIAEAPKVMSDPTDYQARANIMWSGTVAHNGMLGVGREEDWTSHAMEHEISAMYGVAHGAGLAVVFPAWMTYMAERNPVKIAQFGRRVMDSTLEIDRSAAINGIRRLQSFFKGLGLPLTFGELGIPVPDIHAMNVKLHENKGAVIGNYLPLDARATAEIYRLMQ